MDDLEVLILKLRGDKGCPGPTGPPGKCKKIIYKRNTFSISTAINTSTGMIFYADFSQSSGGSTTEFISILIPFDFYIENISISPLYSTPQVIPNGEKIVFELGYNVGVNNDISNWMTILEPRIEVTSEDSNKLIWKYNNCKSELFCAGTRISLRTISGNTGSNFMYLCSIFITSK